MTSESRSAGTMQTPLMVGAESSTLRSEQAGNNVLRAEPSSRQQSSRATRSARPAALLLCAELSSRQQSRSANTLCAECGTGTDKSPACALRCEQPAPSCNEIDEICRRGAALTEQPTCTLEHTLLCAELCASFAARCCLLNWTRSTERWHQIVPRPGSAPSEQCS